MSNVVAGSFSKRLGAVATASMILLSGFVFTAAPASAAEKERVPYTYTVKVQVPTTVWEMKAVKTDRGKGRFKIEYKKEAKTVMVTRLETRTEYRDVEKKAADKPSASEFVVQAAPDTSFSGKNVKEIKVTPSNGGKQKVNLESQLKGNVGDNVFIRVVSKNAAGKSTASPVSKMTLISNKSTKVETFRETYVTRAAYQTSDHIGWGTKPLYVDTSYNKQVKYTERESYTYYTTETYYVTVGYKQVFSHYETYRDGSRPVTYTYKCGYRNWYTCTGTSYEPVYRQRAVYESVPIREARTRSVANTGYRNVEKTRTERVTQGYWTSETDYNNPIYSAPYTVPAQYGERDAQRTVPVAGWVNSN